MRKAGPVATLVAALAIGAAPAAAKPGDVYVGVQDGIARVNPKTGDSALVARLPEGVSDAAGHHLDFGVDGRLYVSNEQNNEIYRVNVKTGDASVFSNSDDFVQPFGLAVAPAGEVVVDDYAAFFGDGALFGVNRAGATRTISNDGVTDAVHAVAVAPNGQILVAPGGPPRVFRFEPKTGAQDQIGVLPNDAGYPEGAAVGADGRTLYISAGMPGSTGSGIERVSLRSGDVRVLADIDPPSYAYDLDVGFHGELFVADLSADTVWKVKAKSGAVTELASENPIEDPIGIAVQPPKCAGKFATVVGTQKKDKIKGSKGPDTIAGLGGKDKIKGLKGKDRLCGGKGRDKLIGGPGRDKLNGQAGKDVEKQ